jgi:hypothetical protein
MQQIVPPNTVKQLCICQIKQEFTFGKFALDNTILYQKSINRITFWTFLILLPNTVYFTNYFFKRLYFYKQELLLITLQIILLTITIQLLGVFCSK